MRHTLTIDSALPARNALTITQTPGGALTITQAPGGALWISRGGRASPRTRQRPHARA